MRVLVFDYGTGNLHSLVKALERCGARAAVGDRLDGADALVLPGVGAFGAAAGRLAPHAPAIAAAAGAGLPVLGICLGMQLLLDGSDEGAGAGLGLVPGRVVRLRARRVPHMGWNTVSPAGDDPLFRSLAGERFYFAHGFAASTEDAGDVAAWTRHEGEAVAAAVRRGRVAGTQFHPEKSGAAGLQLLRNFLDDARRASDCGASGAAATAGSPPVPSGGTRP